MSDTSAGDVTQLHIGLDYRLHDGWFRPYLDGLRTGKAVARQCRACRRATFPPRRVCTCGATDGNWQELSGAGTVIAVTDGLGMLPTSATDAALSFALIALDGADNHTIGRLAVPDIAAKARVHLTTTSQPAAHPTQAVWFAPMEEQDKPGGGR